MEKRGFCRGYHGTSLFAFCSQIYRGKIKSSSDDGKSGERALQGLSGVYMFDETCAASVMDYSHGVQAGWPGVFLFVAWEVGYRNPKASKGGAAKNQVVCDEKDVFLLNLLLKVVPVDKAVAGGTWIYHPPGDSAWDARLEASPFDPTASWCNKDGKSLDCTRAQSVMTKFLEAKAAAGTSGGSSSSRVKKPAEAGPIDTASLAKELKNARTN